MYMSEAAIEPSAVLAKWLVQHPTADPSSSAADWFQQLFPKAYDLLSAQPAIAPSTRFGLLENVLSQLSAGIGSKKDVMLGLARGLGFTLDPEHRKQYVAQHAR
jgi:hypothetical protein